MRQAKSIFLVGELIDATDAKYSDYYHKGTICPFCLDKVFYVKEFDRVVDGQVIQVSASFKHHKGDPLKCEARAKSAEGRKILNALSSESREQRKGLWKLYLWAIFCEGFSKIAEVDSPELLPIIKGRLDTPINKNLSLQNPSTPIPIPIAMSALVIASLIKSFIDSDFYVKDTLGTDGDKFPIDWQDYVKRVIEPNIDKAIVTPEVSGIFNLKTPLPIHHNICLEVIQELVRPENEPILIRISAILAMTLNDNMYPTFIKILYLFREGIPGDIAEVLTPYVPFIETLFSFYVGLVSAIDWYELSKLPWQERIKKEQRRPSPTKGKGFGNTK